MGRSKTRRKKVSRIGITWSNSLFEGEVERLGKRSEQEVQRMK